LIGFGEWGFRVVVQRYYWGLGVTIALMGDFIGIYLGGFEKEVTHITAIKIQASLILISSISIFSFSIQFSPYHS